MKLLTSFCMALTVLAALSADAIAQTDEGALPSAGPIMLQITLVQAGGDAVELNGAPLSPELIGAFEAARLYAGDQEMRVLETLSLRACGRMEMSTVLPSLPFDSPHLFQTMQFTATLQELTQEHATLSQLSVGVETIIQRLLRDAQGGVQAVGDIMTREVGFRLETVSLPLNKSVFLGQTNLSTDHQPIFFFAKAWVEDEK